MIIHMIKYILIILLVNSYPQILAMEDPSEEEKISIDYAKSEFSSFTSNVPKPWKKLMEKISKLVEGKPSKKKGKKITLDREGLFVLIKNWFDDIKTSKDINNQGIYMDFCKNVLGLKNTAMDKSDLEFLSEVKQYAYKAYHELIEKSDDDLPFYYNTIGIKYLKDLGLTGDGITIGILDEAGEEITHSSLPKEQILGESPSGHGLSVSGIIASHDENMYVHGIAPNVKINFSGKGRTNLQDTSKLVIKYYDMTEPEPRQLRTLTSSQIIDWHMVRYGIPNHEDTDSNYKFVDFELAHAEDLELETYIRECIAKKIFIINLSKVVIVGPLTIEAIKDFAREGGIIITAAGNSSQVMDKEINLYKVTDLLHSEITPDNLPKFQSFLNTGHVHRLLTDSDYHKAFLLVGSSNRTCNSIALQSNTPGARLNLQSIFVLAPGEFIATLKDGKGKSKKKTKYNQYGIVSGTSYATPIVTGGTILLYQAFHGHFDPQQIATAIRYTANIFTEGTICGSGMVNFEAAYNALENEFKKSSKNEESRSN